MTQSHIDPNDPETYWILDPGQIEGVSSAIRMTLIDRLAADGPMSPEELASAAVLKPTAVYHHIKKLLRLRLVETAGQRTQPGAKKPQTLYKTPAPRMRLIRAFLDADNADRLSGAAAALLRQADRDFCGGFDQPAPKSEGPDRNHGFFRVAARPNAETLARINGHLNAISDLLWESNDPESPPLALSWVIAPLRDTTSDGDTP